MKAWRLTKKKFIRKAFSGKGAKDNGGRWNSIGTSMVYASEHLSLALLEILRNARKAPTDAYVAIPIIIPDEMTITVKADQLPADWRAEPCPESTQLLGDDWVREGESVALKVPSRFVPTEYNVLINPKHPGFTRIRKVKAVPFIIQADLLK
jgi:RES domain-containing protein